MFGTRDLDRIDQSEAGGMSAVSDSRHHSVPCASQALSSAALGAGCAPASAARTLAVPGAPSARAAPPRQVPRTAPAHSMLADTRGAMAVGPTARAGRRPRHARRRQQHEQTSSQNETLQHRSSRVAIRSPPSASSRPLSFAERVQTLLYVPERVCSRLAGECGSRTLWVGVLVVALSIAFEARLWTLDPRVNRLLQDATAIGFLLWVLGVVLREVCRPRTTEGDASSGRCAASCSSHGVACARPDRGVAPGPVSHGRAAVLGALQRDAACQFPGQLYLAVVIATLVGRVAARRA